MSPSFFRLPMFGFSLLVFLMIGTVLAVAVWAAFRSGETGKNKLGGLAGCAIALALLLIAGAGALGCTAIAVMNAPNEFFRRGPFRRIEAHWDSHRDRHAPSPGESEEDAEDGEGDEGLRIRIEMAGGDVGEITRWFRDHTDEDLAYQVTSEEGPQGKVTYVDVWVPVPREDLEELRIDLEEELHLRLPDGFRVEIRGEDE